jgi:hypothetical protein
VERVVLGVDAGLARVRIGAGAMVAPGPMGQMQDQFWGDRCGTLVDPAGFQWTIATRKEDLTPEELNQRADDFFKQFAASMPRE